MPKISETIPSPIEKSSISKIDNALISNLSDKKIASNEEALKRLQEANRHEKDMVKYGWFGKLFGAEENSSKAITFTILTTIIIIWAAICILAIFFPKVKEIFIETFNVLTPIVTLAFGYLFGKK